MMARIRFALAFIPLVVAAPLRAQDHPRSAGSERLGTVHFMTSCAPRVTAEFDRGMAWLHSFEFAGAIRSFETVLASDSTCAMAWWGIALSRWANPMVPNRRAPALLARGAAAVQSAERLGTRATERERAYIAAVGELYRVDARPDQRARVLAYEQAMARVAAAYPGDTEARIFHAIALVGAAAPEDKSYANQLRAGEILTGLLVTEPDHPGLSHYIIHAYDVPALASRAADAARRYAQLAPSAAHALHMPSHTFTRVGLWNESVLTNLRSMDAAVAGGALAEAFHAADYSVYANLQLRRDSAAADLLSRMQALAPRFDPNAVTGAAPGSAGVFALAAMPARIALERNAWAEATVLVVRRSDFPYAEAMTYFARAIGAARSGRSELAADAPDSLASIRARLIAAGEAYWAEQVAIQELSARGWLDHAAGRDTEALARLREAAAREEATEKAAVTPGPLLPARELLADLLLDLGKATDAAAEYRKVLEREPGRRRSLDGLARAQSRP